MTVKRAWRVDPELFHNQGGQVRVLSHDGLPPEEVVALDQGYRRGDFGVAVAAVTGDVEDMDRTVVTQPGLAYRVITDGQDVYLIEL